MLNVGTVIGAGFASGREILSFFGNMPSYLSVALCAVLFFLLTLLFLTVGNRVRGNDIGTVNRRLAGRGDVVLNICLLFNSAVSLSAMMGGMNSLFASAIFPLGPLYAVVSGLLCFFVVNKGLKGLYKSNIVIVPLLVVFMIAICVFGINVGGGVGTANIFKGVGNSFSYVSMNMMLAAAVLTTVHDTTKKQRLLSSLFTAVVIGLLMTLFVAAARSNDIASAEMPLLNIVKGKNVFLYYGAVAVIAGAIFTTMLSSHLALSEWLTTLIGHKAYSAFIVFLGGLILSFVGFKNVVDFIYPIVGYVGFFYIAINILYLIKSSASLTDKKLFHRGNNKIHNACKYTKYNN